MSCRNKPRTHQDYISVFLWIVLQEGGDPREILNRQLEQLRNLVDSSNNFTAIKFQRVLCRCCVLALTAHTNNQDNPESKLFNSSIVTSNFPLILKVELQRIRIILALYARHQNVISLLELVQVLHYWQRTIG